MSQFFIINSVRFTDLGANNYSNGMHLVSAYPMPENMIQDVLAGKYPGIYLNPSAPCSSEFYGVFGTPEQYEQFYKEQRKAQISKRIFDVIGFDGFKQNLFNAAEKEAETNYKDWWE